MIWVYLLFALVAGAMMPLQAGINSQLARLMQHSILAALASFAVGTLALFIYALVVRLPFPSPAALRDAPWWFWTGGLLGAFFVTAATFLAPRLGAATLLGIAITGQMVVSLVLDHYGLIGFPTRPLNVWRIVGAVLLLTGVALVRRF